MGSGWKSCSNLKSYITFTSHPTPPQPAKPAWNIMATTPPFFQTNKYSGF